MAGHIVHDARRERSPLGRLVILLAAVLSALILVTTVGGWTAYEYFGAQIHRIRLGLGDDRPADAASGTRNFLLVGSDSRAGTGGEYESQGAVTDERSDTTMLAHLDADGTTTMVSFPRDTLVRIPGHGRGKINSAITIGGPSLLIRTIENLTDIKIDHYVSIDLAGFKAMTDAVGGVTVCVRPLPGGGRSNLYDPWSQWRGRVGENRLSGEQALAFVRQRHGLPDNDFDRIRRQQQFIGAVFTQATSSGVLTNPVRLENLLHAATKALTVDDGTSMNDLRALATRLRGMSADQIRFETIPVHAPTPAEGGNALGELPRFGSVQLYEPITLEKFLAPLRGRPSRAAAPAVSPSPTVPPAKVTVDVYNGAGVSGLATSAAAALDRAGFQVGPARTWRAGVQRTTQVRYHPGAVQAARTVQAAVPGSTLQQDATVPAGRVSLVLGTAFEVDTITAAPTPAGAAAGAAAGPTTAGSPAGASVGAASGGATAPATPAPASTPAPATTAAELTSRCTY
ncbi:LCP family protein [Frankia sp. ACN1ag]|uniref:LCP family protein n=1 Tax=Frankia sp. ACN1ag TaxID=102891 RepID=UPI0005D122E9|nr:LCP family protein [Frankia sp. ACN1ag]KQC38927.1 transcriptional regulator [Frankia sp. ACN1ag]